MWEDRGAGGAGRHASGGGVDLTQERLGVLRDVVGVLDRFRGPIIQRVPLTSAVKVDGEALYKKAHRGETAEWLGVTLD